MGLKGRDKTVLKQAVFVDAESEEADSPHEGRHYPCEQCGAKLIYAIGSHDLSCHYCGHRQEISRNLNDAVQEHDLHAALSALAQADLREQEPQARQSDSMSLTCRKCGAGFRWRGGKHAGECPFCGSDVSIDTKHLRPLQPHALLPFDLDADKARECYKQWLKSLWFAPNGLKKYAKADQQLNGIYLPYWTYDSQTGTQYTGRRGDYYYETHYVWVVENGRRVKRAQRVRKTRWRHAAGHVQRFFDDVLVGATKSLPRKITDALEPWDLDQLQPYQVDYLSGLSSQVYQVELDEGFGVAQQYMEQVIRQDICRDIGGDVQQIRQMRTAHSQTHFKYVLLPVWSAAFDFSGKQYRFVVNARNGNVSGERPYSWLKITFAVICGLAVLGGGLWLAAQGDTGALALHY